LTLSSFDGYKVLKQKRAIMSHILFCLSICMLCACVKDGTADTESENINNTVDAQTLEVASDASASAPTDMNTVIQGDRDIIVPDSETSVPQLDAATTDVQMPEMVPTPGFSPTSCGGGSDEDGSWTAPVDCTEGGDTDSVCVFSNHCMCSEGFECTEESQWPGTNECDPGSICVPAIESARCGYDNNDQVPVDCGQMGDENAQCDAELYCLCSDGFICGQMEQPALGEGCQPNVVCIPDGPTSEGSRTDSCGSPNQNSAPVNCGVFGDQGSFCVFGDHCACSEGFVCERTQMGGECEPGRRCVPQD
jgi:hypothetical protein